MRQEQMKNAQKYLSNKRKPALSSEYEAAISTQKTTQYVAPTIPHTTPKKKVTKYVFSKGHKVTFKSNFYQCMETFKYPEKL